MAQDATGTPAGDGGVAIVEPGPDGMRLEPAGPASLSDVWQEVRTRIGAISLLAETLQGERDQKVVTRLAGKLLVEADRVARAIDDTLELSRLASVRAPHDEIVLGTVIAEAVRGVRSAADHRQVTIAVRDEGRAHRVVGDRRQLVSAIACLLDNAVRYADPATIVEVWACRTGDRVALAVRDHGPGLSAADLARVCGGERTAGREHAHSGLGLLVVRHVAANHGGHVTAASVEGEGSVFTLHLPAAAAGTAAEPFVTDPQGAA